ncbi:amino acid ABC transporter substrate-binding protein/permease [Dellaglioa sp. BT-FLS60]
MKKWQSMIMTMMITCGFVLFLHSNQVNAAEKTYTIGTDVTYAPFEYQAENGKSYVGIDMDIMRAVAKEEGFKVQIKALGFNAAVQALEANQIDGVIAGMTVTPERQAKFDFSDSYYDSGTAMAVGKNSTIKSLADLKGKKVAIKVGTSSAAFVNSIKKQYNITTTTFDDSSNMYDDVVTGNSVAAFDDKPVLAYGIKNGVKMKIVGKTYVKGEYGFAVKKGENKELLAKFNVGLEKLKANGKYKKIVDKYTGTNAKSANSKNSRTILGLLKTNSGTLLDGFKQTMLLTIVAIVFATLLGIILGIMGVAPNKWLNGLSSTLIYIFRGLPLIVLAFFIYIGIPNLTGSKIPAFVAGIITLTLNEGAYTAAFVKGGIKAVDNGQMEAARSLGLPYGKSMLKVIMPQGIKIMIPSFINQFIITLKDTSILSVIGILELTQTGKIIIARNLEGFKMWLIIAVIYLVIITLLTWLSNLVERKIK